tara:strand:- start:613 stop:2265 length:1653 start_codon:yes stop_codon:yes gene_type:complete
MTVLPNAPIDPATGLQVPTIAVGTAGGMSVIKDDGTVIDVVDTSYQNATSIEFIEDRLYTIWVQNGSLVRIPRILNIPTVDLSFSSFPATAGVDLTASFYYPSAKASPTCTSNGNFSSKYGINLLSDAVTDATDYLRCDITSTYNTGWMNGDIKGAFLSDTDTTSLVGGELVTGDNSTFTSGTGDWAAIDPANTTITNPSGEMYVVSTAQYEGVTLDVTTVVGQVYTLTRTVRGGTGTLRFGTYVGGQDKGGLVVINNGAGSTETFTHVATSTTTQISFQSKNTIADFYIDDVTFKLADADRSVNANPLTVNGTITKTPVATGADLVAYSGFSATNYLEQPYNSDLDFGTGDFSMMCWIKDTEYNASLWSRTSATNTNYSVNGYADGRVIMTWQNPFDQFTAQGAYTSGQWFLLSIVRRSGIIYTYNNTVQKHTHVSTRDMNSADGIFKVGGSNGSVSLALLRISSTAPSAEQIAKIYNDEKYLFQDGAQATLYGTSNAVTALAHDDATDLLHVGTSGGRSVFQGLRRVSNTTTAVGTAISASNGLVVEE